MEDLFYLIRWALVPVPVAVYSVLWPLWAVAISCLVAPAHLGAICIGRVIGLPFVFFDAAFSHEPKKLEAYVANWGSACDRASQVVRDLNYRYGYERILTWWRNPKGVSEGGLIVGANVVVFILVGSIVSEAFRIVVIVLVVLIVATAIWANG